MLKRRKHIPNLTNTDIERIELKWACIRLNPDFAKDYERQEKFYQNFTHTWPDEAMDEMYMCQGFKERWFIQRLPNPKYPAKTYERRLGKRGYQKWLESLAALVERDPLANQCVRLHWSSEIGKIIDPSRYPSGPVLKRMRGEVKEPVVNLEKLYEELRHCKVVFSMNAKTEELSISFKLLVKTIRAMLKKDMRKLNLVHYQGKRPNEIMRYLGVYEAKQKQRKKPKKQYPLRGQSAEYQGKRQRNRDVQKAKELIFKNRWRLI